MRRSRFFETFGAIVGGIALAITGLSAPAAAAPAVVETIDFDDGTTGSWSQSGGGEGTLQFVESGDGLALQVTDRGTDFTGIQSAAGALEPSNR